MAITFNDIFDLSVALCDAGQTEVSYRSSASRAYYAAYHYALDFCKKHEIDVPSYSNDGAHERLIKALEYNEAQDRKIQNQAKKLAQKLRLVRAERTQADYHIQNQTYTQGKAQIQITTVKRIINV